MNIITGKRQPDAGKIEWAKNCHAGYKGSSLMVCQEPDFYMDFATDMWDLSEWTTKVL